MFFRLLMWPVIFYVFTIRMVALVEKEGDEDMDLSVFAGKSLCEGVSIFCDDPEIFPSGVVRNMIRDFKAIIKCQPGRKQTHARNDEGDTVPEDAYSLKDTCYIAEDTMHLQPSLMPSISNTFEGEHEDLGERGGQFQDLEIPEIPVCPRYATYIYPKRAMTKSKEFKFILNFPEAGEKFQAVRVELCVNPGQSCDFGSLHFNDAHQTICRQRFGFVKLLAVPNDRSTKGLTVKNIELDSFKFPTSCACHKRARKMYGRY